MSKYAVLLLVLVVTACNSGGSQSVGGSPGPAQPPALDPTAPTGSASPPQTTAPSGPARTFQTAALVYNGDGAWTSEVSNLESILSSHGQSYQEVTSAELVALSQDALNLFGTIVWPGGDGTSMLSSVDGNTRIRLRSAVVDAGVGYVGFCAGAFLAVSPAPASGQPPGYFSLLALPVLDYYYLENQGVEYQMTTETFADGTQQNIIWYGGPVTPNIAGGVVAKYPTGDPAITEAFSGQGLVVISGVHPAAPYVVAGASADDFDVAWSLMNAALTQKLLPAF